MSYFDVSSIVLADSTLGRRVHYATKMRRFYYDGRTWYYWLRTGGFTSVHPQVVIWLRHWLTEGVIELEQVFRPRPGHDPSEFVMDLALPLSLVFTGRWGDPYYAHSYNLWNCNCGRIRTETI